MTRRALVLVVALVGLAAPASGQRWNAGDRVAAAGAGVGILADCATTIAALNRGARELNPFLSERPGTAGVVEFCVWGAASTWLVADVVPRRWRRRLLWTVAAATLIVAVHNARQR